MLPDDTMYLQFLQDPVNSRWGNAYLLCEYERTSHNVSLHHAEHFLCILAHAAKSGNDSFIVVYPAL